MTVSLCRFFLLAFLLAPASAFAQWQQPTPDELKMTSDPAAPDAPAVYLFREETVDDDHHFHTMYARIKVLTEKGKEMFSDIEIPYERMRYSISDVAGRTIHADGTVIPFAGKPMDKLIVKTANYKMMAKVFSMPDVQVGSIIEYRWQLNYDDNYYTPPQWYIQQPVFIHKAHYHFRPTKTGHTILATDAWGHQEPTAGLMYSTELPQGVAMHNGLDGYDLTVENIPAVPDEDYMPPFRSFSYRVIFYYSPWRTGDEFWKTEGKYWSKDVDRFAEPSAKIHAALQQIVAAGDSDQQKLEKIYAAVMKLENTSFTREHTAAENKAEGLRVKTAADIWEQKRGSDDAITRLFIALCRAAGFKAYGVIVVNRDRNVLQQGYLDWGQLDDELAIVSEGGKDQFFDPGQRYCEFGKLHWKHTWVSGLRQSDKGLQFVNTPGIDYKESRTDRIAELNLEPDGKVSGRITITMNGTDALRWRQEILRADMDQAKKDFEDELQADMPPGVSVKTNHFLGESDFTSRFMALVDVSGSLGTATGKHVFMPAVFFEAGAKPLFPSSKRENPVDLHYPYSVFDQFTLHLPPGMSVESLPQSATVNFASFGAYATKYVTKTSDYAYGRQMLVGTPFYKKEEYADLRGFFQKTSAQDQSQLVLKMEPVTAQSSGKGQ